MSKDTSNPKPPNANIAPHFHGPVHIRAENVHLGAGDATHSQKDLTLEKSEKQMMKKVEEKEAKVNHLKETNLQLNLLILLTCII